jgi:hypothetical protein
MNAIEHVGVVVERINCLALSRRQMKLLLGGLGKVGRTSVSMTLRRLFVENGPSEIYERYWESDSLDEVKMNSTPLTSEFPRETFE